MKYRDLSSFEDVKNDGLLDKPDGIAG